MEECALRLARTGADLIGINCLFDPFIVLEMMEVWKQTLEKNLEAGETMPYLMCQPVGYRTPDASTFGWVSLPDFPYGKYSNHFYPRIYPRS